jgi:hypothetical protein
MTAQEVRDRLLPLFTHYSSELDRYSEEAFFWKPNKSAWSLGQMYEHLVFSTDKLFLPKIKNCLNQTRGDEEGEKTPAGEKIFRHGSFPPIKIKVPADWQTPDPVPKPRENYRQAFTRLAGEINAISPEVAADAGVYKTRHAVMGMLTALEWFQVLEMHFRHHLRQKKELDDFLDMTSEDTRASASATDE